MRVYTILIIIGISLLVNSGFSDGLQNDVYAEGDSVVRQKRMVEPNSTAIESLKGIQHLNVLGFYTALKELYLTNGFAKELTFNNAVLREKKIPDFVWKEVIKAFELTRWEIKNGDRSLKRINAIIKLNEPESLIREPWLMDLVSSIQKCSNNTRNVAFSIRDIGNSYLHANLTRIEYTNGTVLFNYTKEWLDNKLSSEDLRSHLITPFILTHHIVGPEHFNELGDILEMLPWQVYGSYVKDHDFFLGFYKRRLHEAIQDADLSVRMLKFIREGFTNITGTSMDSLISRLAESEMTDSQKSSIFDGTKGGPVAIEGNPKPTRTDKAFENMSKIFEEIGSEDIKKRFASATKKALTSNILGLEHVKKSLIAGARLIKNLNGSVKNANVKCQQLMISSQRDPNFSSRIDHLINILGKLNGTNNGSYGYELLFGMYFESSTSFGPFGDQLFPYTKLKERDTMVKLFVAISLAPRSHFKDFMTTLAREKYTLIKYKQNLRRLEDDQKIVANLKNYYDFVTDEATGKKIRTALQSIMDISSNDYELQKTVRLIRNIHRRDDSISFLISLKALTMLSRDQRWSDVYIALEDIYYATRAGGEIGELFAPFTGLNGMIKDDQSYEEVFLAMQMILEINDQSVIKAKCQFIEDFYTGVEDVPTLVKAFGVDTDEIRRWNKETNSVDALIQLLKESGSRDNLGTLLAFHGNYTTVLTDPLASTELVTDMVHYLEKNGYRKHDIRPFHNNMNQHWFFKV